MSWPAILQRKKMDAQWYKAWHAWAMINFEMQASAERHGGEMHSLPLLLQYAVPAIQGFFHSVALSKKGNSLQDTLRLLTLWFKFGHEPAINAAISSGLPTVSIDTWLQVIPQVDPSRIWHYAHSLLIHFIADCPYPRTDSGTSRTDSAASVQRRPRASTGFDLPPHGCVEIAERIASRCCSVRAGRYATTHAASC